MNIAEKFFKFSFWSIGFRPFFLMVLVLAVVPTLIWVLQFTGLYVFKFDPMLPNQWHANEMIFGFLLSAIIGFLLTASANWTGTKGLYGQWLFYLFLLFFLSRMVFWFMPFENIAIYAFIGTIVPLLILIHLMLLFLRTKNRRNLILIIPLLGISIGQILNLRSNYTMGYELALFSIRFLIVVIAGRIIPFFTKRAIGLDPRWNLTLLDKINIVSVFLLIFEPFYKYDDPIGKYFFLTLTLLALILNIFRLVNWRLISSFKVQILFILYVAYLWLPIHFLLSLVNYFHWISDIGRASLHALSYGCMGIMILGVVHRVTLGHTGRVIQANTIAIIGYILAILGATVRVFGPLLYPSEYILWIKVSGLLWGVSFILMSIVIIPMLVSPRVEGKG